MCEWYKGLWVARFCVLWCDGGDNDLAAVVARCGSEAWMDCWVFLVVYFVSRICLMCLCVCFTVKHGLIFVFWVRID